MSLEVIAHFNKGNNVSPFPADLNAAGEGGEGSFYPFPNQSKGFRDSGGVIVVGYGTDDVEIVVNAFKKHLKENELSMLAVHRTGEHNFCYHWCDTYLF